MRAAWKSIVITAILAALASGAVDGQENPMSIFTAAKLQNVGQKYLTMWGYIADPLVFVVNKQVWESWTPADRELVRQAAIEAGIAEFIDDHGDAAAIRLGQQRAQQRGLAGAEETGEHSDGNAGHINSPDGMNV